MDEKITSCWEESRRRRRWWRVHCWRVVAIVKYGPGRELGDGGGDDETVGGAWGPRRQGWGGAEAAEPFTVYLVPVGERRRLVRLYTYGRLVVVFVFKRTRSNGRDRVVFPGPRLFAIFAGSHRTHVVYGNKFAHLTRGMRRTGRGVISPNDSAKRVPEGRFSRGVTT